MPTTRKKVIKTVYEDEDDNEDETGDFSDSGSEAKISDASSSEDEEVVESSGDEFEEPSKNKKVKSRSTAHVKVSRKPKFAKAFVNKINKQMSGENESEDITPALISVKDLTDADKLLPSILNLSESDSSDDESSKPSYKKVVSTPVINEQCDTNSDPDDKLEFKDVWSSNMQDDSEEIAKKTFLELEKHQMKVEKTKLSLQTYMNKVESKESDVNDLLAMGEDVISTPSPSKKKITSHKRSKRVADDSDSDVEDWEEVKESKAIPQQGLQLFVEFPNAPCRKNKKLDLDMMMKRKINRVKKEYQVYMHKVHVLSWLGHGNYISCVLNDQELMAAAISLVPSKECYPGERVDMKYVEQITSWYKDKLTLKQDKNEDKFRPKAPPLKDILLGQIKRREVTTRKYLVFIFIAMLRALGLQCRVMFNFVTLPLKPPSSELCSLSTKLKDEKPSDTSKSSKQLSKEGTKSAEKKKCNPKKVKAQIPQVDGNYDSYEDSANDNIMQLDGSDDTLTVKATRRTRSAKANDVIETTNQDVSPPKRSRKSPTKITNNDKNKKAIISNKAKAETNEKIKSEKSIQIEPTAKLPPSRHRRPVTVEASKNEHTQLMSSRVRNTRSKNILSVDKPAKDKLAIDVQNKKLNPPKILITNENVSSKYFKEETQPPNTRKRSHTAKPKVTESEIKRTNSKAKSRTKSAPGTVVEKSKYFNDDKISSDAKKSKLTFREMKEASKAEDKLRVSHKDLVKPRNKKDVTNDLVNIIKNRVKEAKADSKKGIVKGKVKIESDCDSDFLPEEEPSCRQSESDDDFKPVKISPKPSTSRKIDRRVLSSDDDAAKKNKTDVWCEIFVEELEQWISVDVIRGKIHATNDIYMHATHPVCYVVGWDNNNYLKDLTRRYVPHWNTMTRKQRAEPLWWDKAVQPWLGPKTARDKEEDESLDRMQLEAPLPKSIAEYKNHPLYALKRHLLKFEALYPPDAATLGFVRGEAVYARDCVYTCRSRDTWLKEAKVVRLAEVPYKVVKARPKWDKLSNKLITDKPLEVFGPWQVQDYEPPVAEDGIVPRNAYGNVELFKDCMLPKGTVHIKLPGLNKVARKLNIDCAPAMTGFDFNGGWSHPVYDGFVVCKEYEEIITEAWVKDQEDQERREREKIDARVYGNWRRIIKGLFIRERLKDKYGFQELSNVKPKTKSKGPRLVVKK